MANIDSYGNPMKLSIKTYHTSFFLIDRLPPHVKFRCRLLQLRTGMHPLQMLSILQYFQKPNRIANTKHIGLLPIHNRQLGTRPFVSFTKGGQAQRLKKKGGNYIVSIWYSTVETVLLIGTK